jgi:hypothetical protein
MLKSTYASPRNDIEGQRRIFRRLVQRHHEERQFHSQFLSALLRQSLITAAGRALAEAWSCAQSPQHQSQFHRSKLIFTSPVCPKIPPSPLFQRGN